MRCDRCGGLRKYFGPTVVLRDGRAWVEKEKTPPRGDGSRRYHPDCYAAERAEEPSLPAVESGGGPPP